MTMFETIFHSASGIFINLVSAIIVALIGFILGKSLGRLALKILQELEVNAVIEHMSGVRLAVDRNVGDAVTYITYIVTVVLVLRQLDIVGPAIYVLAGGLGILVLLSIGVGMKDLFPNVLAYMSLRKSVKRGQTIKYRNMKLFVIKMGFLETRMRTKSGDILFFPNYQVLKLINEKK